ncbi:MAG TPA: S8 family peptidase [Blastocatellia bacterium]|nr:S8 family peptidase [Blastocatellia bacterium]
MKRYVCLLIPLVFSGLSMSRTVASNDLPRAKERYAPGEVLIKLKDSRAGLHDVMRIVEDIAPQHGRIEALSAKPVEGAYLVRFDKRRSVEETIGSLAADPRIEFAEPNFICSPADTVPNDPFFEFMWGLNNFGPDFVGKPGADVGVLKAWDITTGNRDIVVAVLDTGVDLSHPDLEANAWTNPGETAGNGIDDDRNGYIDDVRGWNFLDDNNRVYQDPEIDGHGTHVAGTVGAVGNNELGVTGVAWNVQVMALKFLDGKENRGFISNAIKAIDYAMDQKRRGVDLRVINASWVSPYKSHALRDAIRAAGEAGILFVCAAGNEGFDIDEDPIYPGAYADELPALLPVAALDRNDRIEPYSNYGFHTVSVGAPGTSVLGLAPEGQYVERSGTSMAAPHVSGVAVLVWSHEPSLTPTQVKQRIISTAEPVPQLGAYCAGSGRVNAYNALVGRVVPPGGPVIGRVEASKRLLTVDGQGFLSGSSLIEINGLGFRTHYNKVFISPNGTTLTRLTLKLGQESMQEFFPLDVEVAVAVFNTTTRERSDTFYFTRRKTNAPE